MAKWPYNGPWIQVRRAVLQRDGWVCRIRGERCTIRATAVDHIVPIEDGGAPYDFANLRAACAKCNRDRQNLRPTATRQVETVVSDRW